MRRILPLMMMLLAAVSAQADILGKTQKGKLPLTSIDVLTFSPDGVLFIGDGRSEQILAVRTGDSQKVKRQGPVAKFDAKVAALMGTNAKNISVIDIAVNPKSERTYVAVLKQDDKTNAVVTVDHAGEIDLFDLSDVEYARIPLKAKGAKISKVTDIALFSDRMVAAGRSSDQFSSKIFNANAPLSDGGVASTFSAETYHVQHSRWETRAPMSVLIPYREDGKNYVVGAFSCTPVVKYPIDSLKPDAKVKGTSMIELGSGNRPIDMIVYEKDGKPYVLANTFRFHHERRPFGPSPYWTVKFEQGLLAGNEKVNEKAERRLDRRYKPISERIEMVEAFHGVVAMDKIGKSDVVVLRQAEGGLKLEVLPLP